MIAYKTFARFQTISTIKNIFRRVVAGKTIICVYIPELSASQKPLYLYGNMKNTYIRRHEGDYRATEADLRRFIRESDDNLDGALLADYTLADLNANSILAFKNIMDLRKPSSHYLAMDNLDFLTEMGVYRLDRTDGRKPKLTVAGLLFLGKLDAIQQKFPHFHLDYINQRGCRDGERWKDRVCTGDLNYANLNVFEFFRIVSEKLRATIEDPFELDENSVRKTPVELDTALREALANMLIHADYFDAETDIKVTVENYYYTFQNPGKMRVSIAQYFAGGTSSPRNNTLILYFRRMGISDRAGTGGKTILNFAVDNKFEKPEINTDMARTSLKIWVASPLKAHTELDNNTKRILEYIDQNRMGTMSQLRQATGMTAYQVHKAIKKLLALQLIITRGRGRATTYLWAPSVVERVDAADRLRDFIINNDF